ncbi:MAG TPA: group 1 truncated hemoglobin [Rhizomicrobium sp.]|nr:group 1 truncated hemoglobin [Rhizomicrobium sp.]
MKALAATFLLLALTTPLWAEDALFDDMGGQPGINKLVDASVDNYLADPRIKDIFSESNIDRIRAELKDQFCAVAGGRCRYTGHSMEATHKGLHLTNANFNALVEDLQSAMDSCNIPFATQNRFLARLAPMQHQVVTR